MGIDPNPLVGKQHLLIEENKYKHSPGGISMPCFFSFHVYLSMKEVVNVN